MDTSGSILNEKVKALLAVTDRVLLDIKYPSDEQYQRYVGCSLRAPLDFLWNLNEQNIPTTLRQVIIPTLNDTDDSAEFLNALAEKHPCVDKIELLPFQKICEVKYRELGLPFRFENFQIPSREVMDHLRSKIKFR